MTQYVDLAIVGAGSAGLIGADFAATLGAKVALLESHRIGGDCTWTGCVPSKALIRAAHLAHDAGHGAPFGIEVTSAHADMPRVRERIRGAVATIYEHTTPEALKGRGVCVCIGPTAFVDAHTIGCGDQRFVAKHVLICTGARATIPHVEGLSGVPFLTYETLFELDALPSHLIVMGTGPIGVEIAQAFGRLGARVTIVGPQLLAREEPETQALIAHILRREGVEVVLERATHVGRVNGAVELRTATRAFTGDRLLVAAGRTPNVASLALERAGVAHDATGIRVDKYLRTNVRQVYACGDVIGGAQFSHLAGWQAFQAVRNALLPGRAAGLPDALPAATFSDPEVARVGFTEAEARTALGARVEAHSWPMSKADRAVCDGQTDGFIKLITLGGRKIIGGTIVAARAGEMIAELTLAVRMGLSVDTIAGTIHAYPTWSSAVQLAALDVMMARFRTSRGGRMIRWLSRLSR
ncbi:MAG TPA: FAD-dependent oxidoreductase [Gemmatimonadaceae bacterium]|nr:FAD-dependent oxidoreductase [Gemmatimonadaceae bacterium]